MTWVMEMLIAIVSVLEVRQRDIYPRDAAADEV